MNSIGWLTAVGRMLVYASEQRMTGAGSKTGTRRDACSEPRSAPRSERSTNGYDQDDVVQSGCCCRYCSVLREMKLRTYASLSHLMPVPVCLFVATFDPTVERAQSGGERRTKGVRRSLRHHGQVACASSRCIVSCRARAGKRTASRPRMWAYRAAWARSRCSKPLQYRATVAQWKAERAPYSAYGWQVGVSPRTTAKP